MFSIMTLGKIRPNIKAFRIMTFSVKNRQNECGGVNLI